MACQVPSGISNRMTAQIRGISMAVKNSNAAISMAQTADGAYGQVTSMLQRMRELAVQAANATLTTEDRAAIDAEVTQLSAEITRVVDQTKFNNKVASVLKISISDRLI